MNIKKQELELQIEELEAALVALKTQLKEIEKQEQHDAIDHLDEHLQMLDHKWDNLRTFWPLVLQELRDLLGKPGNDSNKE
jgi:ATP/maltotriose-dependent transcriptional regulator MalT